LHRHGVIDSEFHGFVRLSETRFEKTLPLSFDRGLLCHSIAFLKDLFCGKHTVKRCGKSRVNRHLYYDLHDLLAGATDIQCSVDIDLQLRKRISLSMKKKPVSADGEPKKEAPKESRRHEPAKDGKDVKDTKQRRFANNPFN
jgi:hypothetical protein